LGAIAGDIIGSVYEWHNIKQKDFPLFSEDSDFTDDTVLTIAIADALIHNLDIAGTLQRYALKYPDSGYGGRFAKWIYSPDPQPYGSYGNGSAMRVSPVGVLSENRAEVYIFSRKTAEVTHNHKEGIRGALAVAYGIFLARYGFTKKEIKYWINHGTGYDMNFTCDEIRRHYRFDVSCQGSVPQAIVAFMDSKSYEDAIRNAISIGGDSDTIACITGGIAAAYYQEVPQYIVEKILDIIPMEFKEVLYKLDTIKSFRYIK